jgi:hypothetical protein
VITERGISCGRALVRPAAVRGQACRSPGTGELAVSDLDLPQTVLTLATVADVTEVRGDTRSIRLPIRYVAKLNAHLNLTTVELAALLMLTSSTTSSPVGCALPTTPTRIKLGDRRHDEKLSSCDTQSCWNSLLRPADTVSAGRLPPNACAGPSLWLPRPLRRPKHDAARRRQSFRRTSARVGVAHSPPDATELIRVARVGGIRYGA